MSASHLQHLDSQSSNAARCHLACVAEGRRIQAHTALYRMKVRKGALSESRQVCIASAVNLSFDVLAGVQRPETTVDAQGHPCCIDHIVRDLEVPADRDTRVAVNDVLNRVDAFVLHEVAGAARLDAQQLVAEPVRSKHFVWAIAWVDALARYRLGAQVALQMRGVHEALDELNLLAWPHLGGGVDDVP